MRSLTHFLRSPSLNEQTLTVPSAIVNHFPSSVFPERRPRKRKNKNTFSAVEDFNSFWWHSGTQQLIGRAKQKQTTSTAKQDFSAKNKTSKPDKPHLHATRPGRQPSGPPYLHSVYIVTV